LEADRPTLVFRLQLGQQLGVADQDAIGVEQALRYRHQVEQLHPVPDILLRPADAVADVGRGVAGRVRRDERLVAARLLERGEVLPLDGR